MKFVIVTGLSGAGKSMAVNALEDIGFFCIDNIPVALLPRIVDFALQGENQLNRVAVVMDVRGVRSSEQLEQALSDLDARKFEYEILFLDANDAVIRKRFEVYRQETLPMLNFYDPAIISEINGFQNGISIICGLFYTPKGGPQSIQHEAAGFNFTFGALT